MARTEPTVIGCRTMTRTSGWYGRGTRQERGYGRQWELLRAATLERDKHLCQPCLREGKLTPAREVDHIVPKFEGGPDDLNNTQAICRPCHQAKTQVEAARAQGQTIRPRPQIGVDGWPVE